MNRKLLALLVVVLTLYTSAVSAQSAKPNTSAVQQQQAPAVHRIVMQLSTADTLQHKALVNNIKHLKEGWGDSVLIEVVVHGPGLDLVTKGKSTQGEAIQQLMNKGIQFVACRNTMKQRGVTEDQILPNVGFVPMGLGEIVRKQEQGWTYIKAGF